MAIYESFHCFLEIIRNVSNNLTGRDILTSQPEFFFGRTPTPFISIGSSAKSTFVVDGISATHCSFNFQQDSLLITANDKMDLIYNNEKVLLQKGDIHTLHFEINELWDFYVLLEWEMEIYPYLKLKGKVVCEQSMEKESIINFLDERYESVKKLSESNRYSVYQISQNKIAKVLNPCYSQEVFQVEEFSTAATKISSLQTNILPGVLDIKTELFPHIVLEHFLGQALNNYLAKKGRVEYREAILVTSKITELLKETKDKNYVCKTLSLKNILCGGDKKVKFTGWNIPIYPNQANIFLAPEYFEEDGEITCSADVYSLGVIFYYLLTGKPIFEKMEHYVQHILNKKDVSVDDLLSYSVHITPQLASLLVSMLSLDYKKRPTPSGIMDWLKDINDTKLWEHVLKIEEHKSYYGLQIISSIKNAHGEICALKDNTTFTIGRSADINIPGDYRISRQHTKIKLKNGICYLEDLGSSNGTRINEKKIKECSIDNGTCFSIGETTLCYWDYQKLREQRIQLNAQRSNHTLNNLLSIQ